MAIKRGRNVGEMVGERIREWELKKDMLARGPGGGERKSGMNGIVVTISRDPGCDAATVGEILAKELGLTLYDREIIEMIARDKAVAARVVDTLDEKGQSELMTWVNESMTTSLSSLAYFNSLKRVLFTIVSHGNAVIIGRGANLLIPTEKRIAIRLVAPLEMRIKHIMDDTGFTEQCARTVISRLAEERRAFIRKYMNKDIMDPTLNDLLINLAVVKPEAIPNIVKAVCELRTAA